MPWSASHRSNGCSPSGSRSTGNRPAAVADSAVSLKINRSGASRVSFGVEDCASAATCEPSKARSQKALSHIKIVIRTNYSNPPAHGAAIMTAILDDADLRKKWEEELAVVRGRIQEMRRLLVETLKAEGVTRDFSFITRQNGMFSFSGLSKEQVETLRENDSIYIVGSGRINVAGLTRANMGVVCKAIARVLQE